MGVGKPHSNSLLLILEKKIQNTDIFNFIISEAFQLSLNGRTEVQSCFFTWTQTMAAWMQKLNVLSYTKINILCHSSRICPSLF